MEGYSSEEDYGFQDHSGGRHLISNQHEDFLEEDQHPGGFDGFGEGEDDEEIVSQNSVLDLSSHGDPSYAHHQQQHHQPANNVSQQNQSSLLDAAHLVMPEESQGGDQSTMIKPRNLDYYQHEFRREQQLHNPQQLQAHQLYSQPQHEEDGKSSDDDEEEEEEDET